MWSTPRLLAIHGLIRPGCEILQSFIRCNIHPNVLHRGVRIESELWRSFLHKKVCSKTLSLNKTRKMNRNQTIGRQYNFIQFNEASMKNEDFGKEFTIRCSSKVNGDGGGSCTIILYKFQSYIEHNTPKWWTLLTLDHNDSTVIMKIVICKHKHMLEKWLHTLIPSRNYICWGWYNRNWKTLRDINNDQIHIGLGIHNTIVNAAPLYPMLHDWRSNIITFRFTSSKKFWTLKIKWQRHLQCNEWSRCITFSMKDTTSRSAWGLGPSSGMRRARDEWMISSSTETSSLSPKSTTIRPKVRQSSMTYKWEESHLVPLLNADLGYNTSSKTVEVTSYCTLVFLFLPLAGLSLAFCFNMSFLPSSFSCVFSKASFTFFALFRSSALSPSMAFCQLLGSKLENWPSMAISVPKGSRDLNNSTSTLGTCSGHTPSINPQLEDALRSMS